MSESRHAEAVDDDQRRFFPMSFAQQRLWFVECLSESDASYNLPVLAMQFDGALDVAALDRAVQHIIARHGSLRTHFEVVDHVPMQVVASKATLSLDIVDLGDWPREEQSAEVQRRLNEETRRPFDLSAWPLMRVLVLRLQPQQHVLLVCMHHIVTDGWSRGIFLRELSAAYAAFKQGREPELPALPLQYADYALRQRESLRGEILEEELRYWREQLQGAPPILELPADRPRPAVQSHRGARVLVEFPAELLARLTSLARSRRCSLFMVLLAAYQVLLYRYTGQHDVVVGSPTGTRDRREFEGLVGFFVNTLVFRVDLAGEPSFEELLGRVREVAFEAYDHQEIPFERLVEELRPERDLSRDPIFQVTFSLQKAPRETIELDGMSVHPWVVETFGAKFDLSLDVTEHGDGLSVMFEYNSDLFDRVTIERMAGHFGNLLEGIVADPRQRISRLPLLSPAELNQLLVEWNDTATDYPKDACIHELFEEQAARTPDAVAIVFEEQQLSYAELNRRANRLARYLQRQGVGPELVVGLCMDRSLEMVVGLLAILKAGGAYLSLDPSDPPERLSFMLHDAGASVLLTVNQLRKRLAGFDGRVVCLDEESNSIQAEAEENPVARTTADSLAYVTYTSGSSGGPKGVAIPHRGVVRLVREVDYVDLDSDQVLLQLASVSFDASTFEIWGSLANGARLVLFGAEKPSLEDLVRIVNRHGITTLWLTAGLFHLLANERIGELKSVRQLLAGGDVLSVAHVQKARQALPDCQLINGYGPTENTTFTCCHRITERSRMDASVPIGRPIANTQVYILDSNMQPVPMGVPGELHTAGAGLARGYINSPALTEERFVHNPFADAPAARLYKTGDLARYLPDGTIEFLGRNDDQVKIRGFRVEPAEVESALMEHGKVESAVVLAQEDTPGEKRLVAYILPEQDQVPGLDELRTFLKGKLPSYMLPSAFVPVDGLPLTRNGKVDRHALVRLSQGRQTEEAYVAPRTPIESRLAEIWKKVLWLEHEVGVHDNFFDLGGHSLLSVRLVAEIEEIFERKLPISALFQFSTIAELAPALEREETIEPGDDVQDSSPILAPEIHHQLAALTAGWQGQRIGPSSLMVGLNSAGSKQKLFWCLQGFRELQQLAKYLGDDQPVYGMRSGHLVFKYTPEKTEALARHYVEEIVTVEPDGPYLVGGNCQAAMIAFEMARQLQSLGKEVTLLCTLERFVPRSYPGRRALFFGRDSEFQPYNSFQSPELGWRKYCPQGFTLDIVPGSHGHFFDEPNVQVLAEKLQLRIAEAQQSVAHDPPVGAGVWIPSEEAYRAAIAAPHGLTARAGEQVHVSVRLSNASGETWPCSGSSGITLGNHWLDESGEVIQWLDGRATFDRDLIPGAVIELSLPVTSPREPGLYLLEFDLVEEGIVWFKEKGSRTALTTVRVSGAVDEANTA